MSFVQEIDQLVDEIADGITDAPTPNNGGTMQESNGGIQIHDGIPMPSTGANGRGRGPRYPLMDMEVGQCFFVNADRTEDGRKEERTLRQTVSRYHRRNREANIRWVVARQDDNRIGVWRKS